MEITRIQRKRSKGWKMPPKTLYVGRPSRLGNPFDAGLNGLDKQALVDKYREWIAEDLGFYDKKGKAHIPPTKDEIKSLLSGYDHVACWCKLDEPCHADVLIEIFKEI